MPCSLPEGGVDFGAAGDDSPDASDSSLLTWAHDPTTGFLRSLSASAGGRCLTSVSPLWSPTSHVPILCVTSIIECHT